MADRISSFDVSYNTGDISIFPEALDTIDELYEVRNNAETFLSHSLSYNGKYLVVDDTSLFPDKGLILVGTEIIYYAEKTATTFKSLKRSFAGSRQNQWNKNTKVKNNVFAEHTNALRDAVVNIETDLGIETNPSTVSLNGILKSLEERFLAPKPIFRANITKGSVPLLVQFQNFSTGDPIRFYWQFGDGEASTAFAPSHVYLAEGLYTVKLHIITSTGGSGLSAKTDYVTIDNDLKEGYFYSSNLSGNIYEFIDQTPGNVTSRTFIFGDGDKETQDDPDIHVSQHTYLTAGTYQPSLIVIKNNKVIKYDIDPIIIS